MATTITGLGSGLDINNIVSTLVAAEKAPKQNQIDKLSKDTTAKITALGSLKSAISDFQTALADLNKIDKFQGRTVSSSKTDLLAASGTAKAGVGSYQVEIQQLAQGSKVALGAVPSNGDQAATFGKGSLTIKLGDTALPAIEVNESNNTLAGLRDAINKAGKDEGVSATIVTDAHGSRLVLSSSKMGDGKDISVAVSGDDGSGSASLNSLAFTPSAAPTDPDATDPPVPSDPAAARMLSRAKSAELTIDGLKVISDSNTVENALEGVTLNLKGVTEAGKPLSVGVSLDTDGVKDNIKKFVDAYNKLMGTIKEQTVVTKVGEDKAPVTGALVGDATVRSLLSNVRNELVATQGDGGVRVLADLGITTKQDGTLELDTKKLDKMVGSNFEDVANLFVGDNGLATRLTSTLKPYTDTGGVLELRNKALQTTLQSVDKQQEDLNRRITSLQERLLKQFNAMDALVGSLQSTANSLTSQLASLPFAKS
ncbi:flagellar capping protein FliD [Pseudomonas sp. ATCC 13867]|uniref:flagellar filament capping protein FliD n=1 Tax=Pseudomonas sp. ATCC 13867 TaxID=1294143 RepID=UPI0002C4F41B|nr:flagellar filament capping protein FliD [Pseudomonas sp. ATCC 13867]AGI23641.1 flagellar capping protein FliD [Pseudomonas sp. ATCC 13867]